MPGYAHLRRPRQRALSVRICVEVQFRR